MKNAGESRIKPAQPGADVLALLDRHHLLARDFHLKRRLFTAMTQDDQQKADAVRDGYAAAVAHGNASPKSWRRSSGCN